MNRKRVLIVDDREENRLLLKAILRNVSCDTDEAQDGQVALERARTHLPDLVVSDILMPGMDGFALCREWMRDERLRSIPFVFFTATYTDERDRDFALSLGAARFIAKPQEATTLLALLEDLLQNPAAGHARRSLPPRGGDVQYLKQYNEVLVHKLEQKMADMEKSHRELQQELDERRKAEARLKEIRMLLEETQKIACIGGWMCDLKSRQIQWTDEVYRIYGVARDYNPSDIQSDIRFYAPESRNMIEQAFSKAIGEGVPYDLELEFVRASGERIWVRTQGHPIEENGKVVRVIGTLMDITDRKSAEQSVREQLAELSRWHKVMTGREARVIELKREVNDLLARAGLPAKYGVD